MHDCSRCGCACYCHGDIDDCQVETEEFAYMNCEGCGCSEDDDYAEMEREQLGDPDAGTGIYTPKPITIPQ